MYVLSSSRMNITLDVAGAKLSSLVIDGKERLLCPSPIFSMRLRDANGNAILVSSYDASVREKAENGAFFSGFSGLGDLTARILLEEKNGEAEWRVCVKGVDSGYIAEWIDIAPAILPALKDNNSVGDGGSILFPYNEGAIVTDIDEREEGGLCHYEPEYPSCGSYAIFPNMLCSQMISYLWSDTGLYIGAHDPERGVKAIDFVKEPISGGVTMQMRLFCGAMAGESFCTEYPIVWSATDGKWESSAERYRAWFESALPPRAERIDQSSSLPEWYEDSPLIVSYPVRGRFDTDKMDANALYPYTNALPIIKEIKDKTGSRIMVLLMHWEGTAPWAPPYVWPPYGDKENFDEFLKELHKENDLLGVYCSGFGYTLQSNLVAEYNRERDIHEKDLLRGMCAGPDGEVKISMICPNQRSGYDICPASEVGREILDEAYAPLFESELDYVQILDQNHGGGQYFCYSKEHGHPPVPGAWMTKNMQKMLSDWNGKAGKTLFGCESAAAEPFIGNLLFSDNRFELGYKIGYPVPLYAYIYHEYLRNFMGNQVSCPFIADEDTLRYRIAYAFAAGDCMTIVINPEGELMPHWGRPTSKRMPDKEKALTFIANLTRFYKQTGKQYLYCGKMIPSAPVECDSVTFPRRDSERTLTLPTVFSSAWMSKDGKRAQILVNPCDTDTVCTVGGKKLTVPALNAILVEM